MKVTVRVTKTFSAAAKPLLKKYKSLHRDLLGLQKELTVNPRMGISLGHDVYKIRLKITSKSKGKSGGARIISLVESVLLEVTESISGGETIVSLITIYDKSEVDNITDKELKALIKSVRG